MTETLTELNRKLDIALAGIKEIEELKEKQRILEKENFNLRESLEFTHKSIVTLTKSRCSTEDAINAHPAEIVNELAQAVNVEKERAIKYESHSRQNNLILYSIPEEAIRIQCYDRNSAIHLSGKKP